MGEYAKRLTDGEEVKIGTCEDMFYLRWDQRKLVTRVPNSLDPLHVGLRYRVPWPDEADLAPGDIKGQYNRTERLYRTVPHIVYGTVCEDFPPDADMVAAPGRIQLTHPAGLVVGMDCHHGAKLPEVGDQISIGWNGKDWSIGLRAIKSTTNGPRPVICCRHCGRMWSCDWADVLPFVPPSELFDTLCSIQDGMI